MKLLLRVSAVLVSLGAILVVWRRYDLSSWPPFKTVGEYADRLLNVAYFNIGNLPVTPLFLLKVAAFLLLLGLGARVVRKIMRQRVLVHTSMDEGLQYSVAVGAGYLFFIVGLVVGLQSLGLNLTSIAFLGGAVGIGVGVGLQPVVNNFVSGLILLVERPIKVGDRIEIAELAGDVVKIAARSTWVRTNDNVVIIVPNSEFTTQRVTNWTANDRRVRVSLPVGTSYSSDPEQVRKLLLAAAREHADVLSDPAPDVVFTGFGDSSLNFDLRIWTTGQLRTPQILRSDLYFAVFRIFKEQGIEIPFPQRDLHLRSVSMPIPFMRTDNPEKQS
jgi:small-conductance mechanosensitive channel